MSCKYCEHRKKQSDFDGETYVEIRIGKTFGYPAIISAYRNASCIASYGINNCPWCGRDLKECVDG